MVATAGCTATLTGVAPPASAATLGNCAWTASKVATGATGVSYGYALTAATAASLTSVTMTVPTGTGGTPTVGTVSPVSLAGGSVSLSGTTLTYSFTAAAIASGTAISIQVNGLTNTATAGSYTAQLSTRRSTGAIDTGTSGPVALTGSTLSSPAWSSSSTLTGAAGVSYTYTFTPPALVTLITSITMTVPPGTAGSPAVGTVSPSGLAGGTVALSGTTLTYTTTGAALAGTAISIQVNGLTNTATAGSYTSEIVTNSVLGPVSTGVTPALTFAGPLTLTSPGSLTWTGTLTGLNQPLADATAGDQQLTVNDATGTGAGWHVTVSATAFSNGTYTFPNTGTFTTNGSLSSVSASTAPSASCLSCIPPGNTTTYPVAITTASSSPPPATVYDVAAGSGTGAITLGGHSAANPFGWWVNVPASARAGAYTSTVTVAVVSGP
jgi:hypothetical protein